MMVRARDAQLEVGANLAQRCARLGLLEDDGAQAVASLTEGQLQMAIGALVSAYADLVGANRQSVLVGVNRALTNRTRAARERRERATRAQGAAA